MAGFDSSPPLQLSLDDLLGDLADPRTLGLDERDLVLELDHRQAPVGLRQLIEKM
jgi:hypothetical protein